MSSGGQAQLCKVGGWQGVWLNWRVARLITHELMHTLCFNHEMERRDRDKYLDTAACSSQIYNGTYDSTLDMFYDYTSAMHYPCDACYKPKMAGVTDCWTDDVGSLSVLDVEKINKFYEV